MLDVTRLKGTIKAMMLTAAAEDDPSTFEACMDSFAQSLATCIVNEVKNATITHTINLVAGPYPVTGTITSTLE